MGIRRWQFERAVKLGLIFTALAALDGPVLAVAAFMVVFIGCHRSGGPGRLSPGLPQNRA